MAKKNRQETPAEFRARMLSIGYIKGGRTNKRNKEKIVVRKDSGIDAGKKAKVYQQDGDGSTALMTESDNRLDCNITPETHYQEIGIM